MADDTDGARNGREGTDSRVEDTTVDSAVDGSVSDAPQQGDPGVTDVGHGSTDGSRSRVRTAKPRRRWPWVTAVVVLTGLVAASAVLTYQARERSEQWSDQVDEITATSYGLGEQIAAATTENIRLSDQISLLEEQLSNSKDTVLKLSDEKAQWRDDTEFAQQQVASTEDLLTRATEVANGLQRCTDGQSELMTTLAAAEDYEPDELAAYQASVVELCAQAEQANASLQRALAQ